MKALLYLVLGASTLSAAACSASNAALTLRGSTPCPPGSGQVETWCDDAGNCEWRVSNGGVYRCNAGDSAACTQAASDAANACRSGQSTADGGPSASTDGGTSVPSGCGTDVPCVDDTQCVAVAGTSCNTSTHRCQTVLCGAEGDACSTRDHCTSGLVCAGDVCRPGGSCVYEEAPICVTSVALTDQNCREVPGEFVAACPSGSVGSCSIEHEGLEEVLFFYPPEFTLDYAQEWCNESGGTFSPS